MLLSEFIENHIAKSLEAIADDLRLVLRQTTRRRDTFSAQQCSVLMQIDVSNNKNAILSGVPKPRLPSKLRTLIGKRLNHDVPTSPGRTNSPNSPNKTAATISYMSVLEWPSLEIARQITIIEFEMFELIQPKECLSQSWNKPDKHTKAPNISKMISFTNRIVAWVSYEILSCNNTTKRSKACSKFIKVACELRKLNNFNACKAVIAGLKSNPVFRLRRTWVKVPAKQMNDMKELETLMEQAKNFHNMRNAIKQASGCCLPYIGIFLTDLTFIEDGNKDFITSGDFELINLFKRMKQASVIKELVRLREMPYALQQVTELSDLLYNMTILTEDELYDLSLQAEPREI
ncbi:Ras guanine nucleotide exchange factor gefJ [Acrasis kona]|uniref:Ras guanine nucleotide exchange factor gefJ n=1 Tax=Acrasis kona TaxID=1008807 RepID=A0AAW2Z9U4_9EUKA